MQHRKSDASSARNQLPPLAPRGSRSTATSIPESDSIAGAAPPARSRVSHRSRTGCWTCRNRKVKCDEVHPRCGPCTRLNRGCDWEFRWKFDDVTVSTQNRYNNVSTAGNAVWDPQAARVSTSFRRSQSPNQDELPSFAELTNDEDRERRAETRAPGTYNVIVNPESFARLPEYGIPGTNHPRRTSAQSAQSSFDSRSTSSEAIRDRRPADDPDIVVLSKFEDAPLPTPSFSAFESDRRTSLPENLQRLEITVSPRSSSLPSSRGDLGGENGMGDERLLVHYLSFIAKRLLPFGRDLYLEASLGQEDPIIAESRTFPPLRHAICAISLLSLALKGQQQLLPEAFQHYQQAISTSRASTADLLSDRLLYLHFLLLIYDICCTHQGPSNSNDGSKSNMWVQHMQHLVLIATNRRFYTNGEFQSYLLWFVLCFDIQATLVGDGEGCFVQAFLNNSITIPSWHVAYKTPDPVLQRLKSSVELEGIYTPMFTLTLEITRLYAQLSKAALCVRSDAIVQDRNGPSSSSPSAMHRLISQTHAEACGTWNTYYPGFLPRDVLQARLHLPDLAQFCFDYCALGFSTIMVYLRTSMYPGQQCHNSPAIQNEVQHHCATILSLVGGTVESQNFDQHQVIFPLFLGGFASADPDAKIHAINLMQAMEDTGIGRNVTRSLELLIAVCEEQRRNMMTGRRAEEVDWIVYAKARDMGLVNFGL